MSRINLVSPADATGTAKTNLDQVTAAFGMTPNMFRAAANSPAALQSLWGAFGALGQGTLGSKLGEQIAVAIADIDRCDYCLSAHTLLGQKAGASVEEMAEAQAGRSNDPRTAAALTFVGNVVKDRAHISNADVDALRAAGFDDGQVVELLAHVALNLFTNYLNVALNVPVDFPGVKLRPAA